MHLPSVQLGPTMTLPASPSRPRRFTCCTGHYWLSTFTTTARVARVSSACWRCFVDDLASLRRRARRTRRPANTSIPPPAPAMMLADSSSLLLPAACKSAGIGCLIGCVWLETGGDSLLAGDSLSSSSSSQVPLHQLSSGGGGDAGTFGGDGAAGGDSTRVCKAPGARQR